MSSTTDKIEGFAKEKTGPVATQNAPPQPGFLKRWLERRRLERLKQQEEQLKTIELELDGILAKLHVDGMQSLSDALAMVTVFLETPFSKNTKLNSYTGVASCPFWPRS